MRKGSIVYVEVPKAGHVRIMECYALVTQTFINQDGHPYMISVSSEKGRPHLITYDTECTFVIESEECGMDAYEFIKIQNALIGSPESMH